VNKFIPFIPNPTFDPVAVSGVLEEERAPDRDARTTALTA
jgi:hypothetical protein